MRPSGNWSASSVLYTFGLIHLPEDCRRVLSLSTLPAARKRYFCNHRRTGKCKLGSRKNANRHSTIFRRSETACASTKVTCGEFVANLRRPPPDVLKAVVTHCRKLPV